MIKIYRFLLLSFLLSVFNSCSNNEKQTISSISVHYLKGHIEYPKSLRCSELFNDKIIDRIIVDTIIHNPIVLSQVDSLIKLLKPDSLKFSLDSRIRCVINFESGENKTLCLGERIGTKYYNVYSEDNHFLSYLIKSNSGYYQYFPIDFLEFFPELNDSLRLIKTVESMNRKLQFSNDTIEREVVEIKRF